MEFLSAGTKKSGRCREVAVTEMPTSGELESGDLLFFNDKYSINMGMPEDII